MDRQRGRRYQETRDGEMKRFGLQEEGGGD